MPANAQSQNIKVETALKGLEYPWSLNFAPDGELYLTERPGKMLRIDLKANQVFPIGDVPKVRAQGEAGLLGMALDPSFADNGTVYICYSTRDANGNPSNRVAQFALNADRLTNEKILIDDLPGIGSVPHGRGGCRLDIIDFIGFAKMLIGLDGMEDHPGLFRGYFHFFEYIET